MRGHCSLASAEGSRWRVSEKSPSRDHFTQEKTLYRQRPFPAMIAVVVIIALLTVLVGTDADPN
jgi:hypothetical protein